MWDVKWKLGRALINFDMAMVKRRDDKTYT